MNERRRVFLLIGIMGAVSLIVGGVLFHMLYQARPQGTGSKAHGGCAESGSADGSHTVKLRLR